MRTRTAAALVGQRGQHRVASRSAQARARDLVVGQVAEPAQHVVQRVARSRLRALGAVLEVGLDALQRVGVDELAQLLLAEQLAQQVAIQRQRGGAPLGVGRVALVHVGRDVVEQQRRGERRGCAVSTSTSDSSRRVQPAQQLVSPGRSRTSRRHSR